MEHWSNPTKKIFKLKVKIDKCKTHIFLNSEHYE